MARLLDRHATGWLYFAPPGGVFRDGICFNRRVRGSQLHRTHPADRCSRLPSDAEAERYVQPASEDDDASGWTASRWN